MYDKFCPTKIIFSGFLEKNTGSLFLIKYQNNYECAYCANVKDKSNMDILQQKLSMYVHPFDRQRHLKDATITLKMDSVIPPFWKNPPPDFLGLSGQ